MENNNEIKKIGEDDKVVIVTCLKCKHQKALNEEDTVEFKRKVVELVEAIEDGDETAYCSSEYEYMDFCVARLAISDEYNEEYEQNECECRFINEEDFDDCDDYKKALAKIEPNELTDIINELYFRLEYTLDRVEGFEAYKKLTSWSLREKCAHYAVHEQRQKQREEAEENESN